MFGHNFYHASIRKYVALFGTLFNDIHIERTDGIIKVPISYGPREKVLARVTEDPSLTRPAAILPRMSFEITNLDYANERKLNTLTRRSYIDTTNTGSLSSQYNPVPYDIEFTLSIMVKSTEDGTRIVEQILPFFTPEWTATAELIPEMGIVMDIPVVLKTVTLDDQYEGSFEERRALIWTLRFTMKAFVFGPTKTSKVIRFTNIGLFGDTDANTAELTNINIEPGLTASGGATSNSLNTIDKEDIYADDNYGYIVTITDN